MNLNYDISPMMIKYIIMIVVGILIIIFLVVELVSYKYNLCQSSCMKRGYAIYKLKNWKCYCGWLNNDMSISWYSLDSLNTIGTYGKY